MLEIQNLKKTYGDFSLECSMRVPKGCITGLIGPNGAGKTTIFKSILGLISIDQGKVFVLGKEAQKLKKEEKENMGVVLSDAGFSGYLTIKDLLPMLSGFYHRFDKQEFLEKCEKYKMPLQQKIKDFSTGMKARLKVLAAITHKPDFLLLDEPTSGLDVLAREDLLFMLREYMEEKEERAILISSHISTDLEGLCDELYMLQDGRMVLHEDMDVLLSDYGILKLKKEQYDAIDKQYLLRVTREAYGFCCLTNQKRFYLENLPGVVIENGSVDDVIAMITRGEVL